MEQKERYEWHSYYKRMVLDNKTNKIIKVIDTLNQQYKRIKELEQENQQLNQQLHDLPKKIVEDIKIQMGSVEDILINCGNGKEDALCWINRILDTVLKKYGGE